MLESLRHGIGEKYKFEAPKSAALYCLALARLDPQFFKIEGNLSEFEKFKIAFQLEGVFVYVIFLYLCKSSHQSEFPAFILKNYKLIGKEIGRVISIKTNEMFKIRKISNNDNRFYLTNETLNLADFLYFYATFEIIYLLCNFSDKNNTTDATKETAPSKINQKLSVKIFPLTNKKFANW